MVCYFVLDMVRELERQSQTTQFSQFCELNKPSQLTNYEQTLDRQKSPAAANWPGDNTQNRQTTMINNNGTNPADLDRDRYGNSRDYDDRVIRTPINNQGVRGKIEWQRLYSRSVKGVNA